MTVDTHICAFLSLVHTKIWVVNLQLLNMVCDALTEVFLVYLCAAYLSMINYIQVMRIRQVVAARTVVQEMSGEDEPAEFQGEQSS